MGIKNEWVERSLLYIKVLRILTILLKLQMRHYLKFFNLKRVKSKIGK